MAEYILVCTSALAVAALTLYSGFGLGTLLMPVFAVFFPVQVAVALTAVVHLLNNLFKAGMLARYADMGAVLRFGVPAAASSVAGAMLLGALSGMVPLFEYELSGSPHEVTPVKLVIALLLAAFSALDLHPRFSGVSFDRRYISTGGTISGFFGGLSGMQGALRSAFLVKAGLGREGFVATGALCAVLVDLSRLTVYGASYYDGKFSGAGTQGSSGLLIAATAAAFTGSYTARKYLHKFTVSSVRITVGVMLFLLSLAIGTGLI